ncbi:TPA: IS3 family transposase [Escherichia coli]|nr:IS3 family transposase [Escherichia coli]
MNISKSGNYTNLCTGSVIREYIEIFYNRQRRHSRLGNISPAAFREKYHQMAA